MALVVESFASASSATTSVAVTKPTGVASGDLVIGISRANNATAMSSSDFTTEIFDVAEGADNSRLAMYYKIAGGSEPASYTFTGTSSNNMDAIVVRVSGADTTTPFDTFGTTTNSTPETTSTAPSINTAGANYLVIRAAGLDGGAQTFSATPDTEIARVQEMAASYKIQASAGATGTGDFTHLIEQSVTATASFVPAGGAAARRAVVVS